MKPHDDRAAVAPLPPALASPALAEAERARLGHELENYLAPLVAYCEAQQTDDTLGLAEFRHGQQVRQALDAFIRYERQTEQLLGKLREALAYGQQQAQAQVPDLDEAVQQQAAAAEASRTFPVDRTADPLYRLGWVRGYRQAAGRYERVVSLYALHATLVAPPGYEPSPLVARLERHLAGPSALAYAGLPLATRQAIDALHPVNRQRRPDEPGQAAA